MSRRNQRGAASAGPYRVASKPAPAPVEAPAARAAGSPWWPIALLVGAVVAAYANSFSVPFLFDDRGAIVENASLNSLASALRPPVEWGLTVAGRPLLNLSFALNRWLGGDAVWGFHAGNVLIHALAALALFGVVRRTLELPAARWALGGSSRWIACGVAALWALHPLQTESVTYLAQRAESLVGLLLLCTLYAFIRALDGAKWWAVVAVVACWLGMAAKEVMAVAPLLVLLFDRTFAAGTFREALARRWKLHLAFAASWLFLGWLVFGAGVRGGSAGLAAGVTPWSYALKQAEALVHYLRLVVWPHPLVLDYGTDVVTDITRVLPQLAVVLALLGATLWALVRSPRIGFLGAWFFAVLAPTSSVIPVVTQTMAEHRMYLALAPLAVFAVCLARRWLPAAVGVLAVGLMATVLLVATAARNTDFQSELGLWEQIAARRPQNPRAQYNVGVILLAAGRAADAVAKFENALALQPDYLEAHNNLGSALLRLGRPAEALPHYEAALRIVPDSTRTLNNLAVALLDSGRSAEVLTPLARALELDPKYAEAHFNRGNALGQLGRFAESIAAFETALRLAPEHRAATVNLAQALAAAGRPADALARLAAARTRDPQATEFSTAAGNLCFGLGRLDEAAGHYRAALALDAQDVPARFGLANVQARRGDVVAAVAELRTLLEARPDFTPARAMLEQLGGSP